ncbi:adenylate/guanylate cyclase domain-containing protein [uncultured Tateyamaria sp.]|uniref:adenylate/guanylate cyclase domain-containing protein n=1 Tax=uncultured Tateyamaria sp. TaxID=455651 RepID=UPI0026038A2B|nr:adenylate/guanylate cyclase domain-containing protein [uncultured Tateyamaria sp.]
MVDISNTRFRVRRASEEAELPKHRHAREALERNKREGMDLAVKARIGALGATALLLVFLNPNWDVLWYHGLLVALVAVGLAQRRVGRVGQSRAELGLLFADLVLMTVALLVPNPFSTEPVPTAMIFRFEVFQFFSIILAAGVLTYSWRTIIAMGNWTAVMWLLGAGCVWWFGRTYPALSEGAAAMFPDNPDLARLFDPNAINWDLRIQEVIVFFIMSAILAVAVRRYQLLVLDSAEMARERTNLARYFSPTMVEELSTKDEPLGQIRSHDAAVLFVDIVGFTTFSDGRPPQEVIETLRAFHARMESEVFAHGGTLDKYLGDGLMATFGTPLPASDDAARAVACVRAMAERMVALNTDRRIEGLPEIDARFGLHYGAVVLGDIGANRLEFAVLGDTVNVASRLEAMTRALNVRAIVSDAAMAAATQGSDAFRRVPDQAVRGVAEPLPVWVLD